MSSFGKTTSVFWSVLTLQSACFLDLSHYWCSLLASLQFTESQNCWGWEGPLEVTQPNPLLKQAPQSRLQRKVSRWVFNIPREGDFTASLGNLCPCLVTFTVEKCFLMFRWETTRDMLDILSHSAWATMIQVSSGSLHSPDHSLQFFIAFKVTRLPSLFGTGIH